MNYETNCTQITLDKWEILMKNATKADNQTVVKAAIETGVISKEEGRKEIENEWYNPYEHLKTKTHFIYVHSAIEHFILI